MVEERELIFQLFFVKNNFFVESKITVLSRRL